MFRNLHIASCIRNSVPMVSAHWTWDLSSECPTPNCDIIIFKLPESVLFENRIFGESDILRWIKADLVDLEDPATRDLQYTKFKNKYGEDYEVRSHKRQLAPGQNIHDGNFEIVLSSEDLDKIIYICVFCGDRFEEHVVTVSEKSEIAHKFEAPNLFDVIISKTNRGTGRDLYALRVSPLQNKTCVLVTKKNGREVYSVIPDAAEVYVTKETFDSFVRIDYVTSLMLEN